MPADSAAKDPATALLLANTLVLRKVEERDNVENRIAAAALGMLLLLLVLPPPPVTGTKFAIMLAIAYRGSCAA